MNIAFVTSSKIWSGVKTWMLEFGEALGRRGHNVHVFANDGRFLDECAGRELNVHAVRFGSDYNPGAILRFRRLFRELDIDVACMNVQKEMRTAGIAAVWRGIPVVHRVGLVRDLTGKFDERMTHRLVVSGLLVTSRWMRNGLLEAHNYLHPDRISVVFNGKDLNGQPAREMRSDPVRFVAAYRLAPDKLHIDLLQAFRRMLDAGLTRFSCDIYGDGPMDATLETAIGGLGLGNHVHLKGFLADVPQVLPQYDFGVLTSRIEGLSNTVLEYMAAGLPVVSTNRGALTEIVDHRGNGFCYDPGDVQALTGHLSACLQMPDSEYARMSIEALGTIRQHFQQDHLAGQLERYLRQLADRGTRVQGLPGARPA